MNLLDPTLGGKIRSAITFLGLVLVILTALEGSATQLRWVSAAAFAVRSLIAFLTHFTEVGNTPPEGGA